MKHCSDSVKSLYNILEVTFDPLTLCGSIAPLFTLLAADTSYVGYLPLLQRALLSRLLSQLSQVYSSIEVSQLLSFVSPLKNTGLEGADTFDDEQVEAYIMRCARRGELNIRVDHAAGSITFVDNAFSAVEDPSSSTMAASVSAVQPSTAESVRTSLNNLATSLHNSLLTLYPPTQLTEEEQKTKFDELVTAAAAERKALQLRRAIVARRRELLSELSIRKEKEAASRRAEISRREKDEEQRRTVEEARKREIERARREIESIRAEEAKKLAQSLKAKGSLKVDIEVRAISIICCSYADTLVRTWRI